MKQIYIYGQPELRGEVQEVDIPYVPSPSYTPTSPKIYSYTGPPNDHQVVIKVIIAGSNPKDWKLPVWGKPGNSGDDAAGYIHSVGSQVTQFKKGDRAAIFHEMLTEGGTFAEYAVAWEHTTFHLAENVSFEEGATIPLAAMTSAIGLFISLRLPTPLLPATQPIPLLIYGASSAVSAYAIKFAQLANIHPIIGVAGSGGDFAKSIGADVIALQEHAKGEKLLHVYDAISEGETGKHISEVASEGAYITHVLQNADDYDKKKNFTVIRTTVGDSHNKESDYKRDFATAYFRLFSRWLADGRLKAHPHEVAGGLDDVVDGLKRLKEGKVSAKKLVFKVADE
ncbi:NADPH2:quinone reductase [Coprinopsis sp. MPI-PUGE-AT-0042]|nr:NADPH2:quinone reductase [Coprinopsis sp. MPI-PUGE-AT-0042]